MDNIHYKKELGNIILFSIYLNNFNTDNIFLYHYYIGGIILVSYPYHLKAEKCRRNERGLHA